MKIIKKPKIPVQTCGVCACIVQIKTKDLVADSGEVKDSFKCPICCAKNKVNFEKAITEEKTKQQQKAIVEKKKKAENKLRAYALAHGFLDPNTEFTEKERENLIKKIKACDAEFAEDSEE